jgi:hypothetical protein
MQVIKNVDIKVSYLADAELQCARRLCAEGGKDLTDAQVLEIEANMLRCPGRGPFAMKLLSWASS